MIEVLWHGRGGQGAFTAARLLGAAGCYSDGSYGLAFPSFGPERRGAPMRAYTKLDVQPIGDRSAIQQADYVVYLDDTLFEPGWESQLKPGGVALVNTTQVLDEQQAVAVDASGISKRLLGRDIPNTVFVALICGLADTLSFEDAKSAIKDYMAPKLHSANISVVEEVAAMLEQGLSVSAASNEDENASASHSSDSITDASVHMPPARIIPTLQSPKLDPVVYARNTCWEAGHLVTKNAGWRTMRPVVDEAGCIGCMVCYMHCPDGTIFKTDSDIVAIDYDFCKGCGICVKVCSRSVISMIPEGGEE